MRGANFRIGTVRRLPRGVQKERYAADDWFDVWYGIPTSRSARS